MRPISEKAAEILFSRSLLQALGLRTAQLFAPSSWEEHQYGYDQSIVGFSAMREINLQFKSPEYTEKGHRFTIYLHTPQHQTLQRRYPQNKAAYYVAHMFASLKACNEAQADPNLTEARSFLRHFLCIDVRSLPSDARSISYIKPASHRHSPEPSFKTQGDGRSPKDAHALGVDTWERGSTLFEKLTSGTIGIVRDLSGPHQAPIAAKGIEPRASDLGLCIRIPQSLP
jgi:hypothetical protein